MDFKPFFAVEKHEGITRVHSKSAGNRITYSLVNPVPIRLPLRTSWVAAASTAKNELDAWDCPSRSPRGILEPHVQGSGTQSSDMAEFSMNSARWGAGFSAMGRFIAEIEAAAAGNGPLRSGYVLAGDEVFLLDRCRAALLKAFVAPDLRDFCLSDLDLASSTIFEVLDRAQTPSLMAPFQLVFIRNVRQLSHVAPKRKNSSARPLLPFT